MCRRYIEILYLNWKIIAIELSNPKPKVRVVLMFVYSLRVRGILRLSTMNAKYRVR